jgi:hypothetical protein
MESCPFIAKMEKGRKYYKTSIYCGQGMEVRRVRQLTFL